VASLWLLVAARFDAGTELAPPRGPVPWGGVEQVLPRLR
jgi:hypothetical protein